MFYFHNWWWRCCVYISIPKHSQDGCDWQHWRMEMFQLLQWYGSITVCGLSSAWLKCCWQSIEGSISCLFLMWGVNEKRIHEEIPAQRLAQQQRSTSTAQDSCSELKNAMTASNRCPPSLMLHENDAATLANTAASTVSCSLTKQLLPSSWTTFNEH